MQPLVCLSVCLSVCMLVTTVRPTKKAEPVNLWWVVDSGGPKEPCIRWGTM